MARFKVYYDGKCRVCSHEIEFYRKKPGASEIDWIDISLPGFNAQLEEVNPLEVLRVFHVRDESGQLVKGVDGFIEIWKRLPDLKAWVKASQLPGARALMRMGYRIFVRIRPFLPRKKDDCSDGYCDHR